MSLERQFGIAIWMLALGVSFATLWWGTTYLRKRAMRTFARILIVPVLTVLFALPVRAMICIPFARGAWKCSICGAAEEQIHLGSIPILHRTNPDPRILVGQTSDELHEPHRHDWSLIGGLVPAVSRDVNVEIVLQTGTWLLGILFPFAGAWIATSWIRMSPSTLVARSLLSVSVACLASPWIHAQAMEPFSRATWKCSVCGTSEFQVRFRDLIVYRSGRHSYGGEPIASIASAIPHEHDWLYWWAIIAHGDGDFMCNLGMGDACDDYFSCLDQIPSPEIARSMIHRVARGTLEERRALLEVFASPGVGEPFASLWPGARAPSPAPSRDAFERDYVAWLDRHPEWK